MDMVHIRGIRPFFLRGDRVEVQAVVKASPTDAVMAVATGRAAFVSQDDCDRAHAAQREADAKACPHVSVRLPFWSGMQ